MTKAAQEEIQLTRDVDAIIIPHGSTTKMPKGTRVSLVRDPALDDRDRYGRLLRYLFVRDENVNVELVRDGAASPYFFRGDRGRFADELLDAVDEARAAHRGYWGACPGADLNTGLGSITGRR